MSRVSRYITHVKPRLKDIEQMALTMTQAQICECLGIKKSAWYDYKKRYPELAESLKKGREQLVYKLKSTMIEAASGYHFSEKKVIKERDPDTGEMVVVRIEETEKYSKPDIAALNLLLKNYDRDYWRNDPAEYELKKRALELQEQKQESSAWDGVA